MRMYAKNIPVDDQALDHLKSLTNLQKLVVGKTELSKEAIEELRESLSTCLIVGDV